MRDSTLKLYRRACKYRREYRFNSMPAMIVRLVYRLKFPLRNLFDTCTYLFGTGTYVS